MQKFYSLDEIHKFFERDKLGKLSQKEIENLNRSIFILKINFPKKLLKKKKIPGPDCFISQFYKTFKEEIIQILCKFFQKTKEDEILPKSFLEAPN